MRRLSGMEPTLTNDATNDAVQAALAQIERDRSAVIGFLQTLIGLQAKGEDAIQAEVSSRLAAIGATIEQLRFEPSAVPVVDEFAAETNIVHGERTSVVGEFKSEHGGQSLILFAHPDGEPIGDTSNWTHDPFAGTVEGGRLYG
jgi:acetylornithine deacetylase